MISRFRRSLACLILWLCVVTALAAQNQSASDLSDIREYIAKGWDRLTRSLDDCRTVKDLKTETAYLYLPADLQVPEAVRQLEQKCPVKVKRLPHRVEKPGSMDPRTIQPDGLLYLEHSYVVPGGFFNEMYGWDSYFIIRGLLRDGKGELARGMVENFFFEIEHYGAILNANRTYFLTRSQPPFLTSMVLAVYEAEKARGKDDREWLARGYQYAQRNYQMWMQEPHLAGTTGLSRYYDFGNGPAPEVLAGEDQYYRVVSRSFVRDRKAAGPYLASVPPEANLPNPEWPSFTVFFCDSGNGPGSSPAKCDPVEKVGLTADFYKGDRSMRESGFDISYRFGPFSAATHHYAAVCLNSLLYKAEIDMERMASVLERPRDSQLWRQRARDRATRMTRYFWDEKRGMFFDYNATTGSRSTYEYVTTFYPLWAGLATPRQAAQVVQNLSTFEQPGGLAMSRTETKVQWDFPYGWAPLQLLAVEGLRRYGYHAEADRVAQKFVSTVLENFRRDGTIREKYNVVRRSTEARVEAGYQENVIGFGWTNGVFLELLHGLGQRRPASASAR